MADDERWYMGFYIGHLHVAERTRIRQGNFNPQEREMLAKGEDPWAKFRGPLPPGLHPPEMSDDLREMLGLPRTAKEKRDTELLQFMPPQLRAEYDKADEKRKVALWKANERNFADAQEREKHRLREYQEKTEKTLDLLHRVKEDPSEAHLLPPDDSSMDDLHTWYEKMSKPVRIVPFPGEGGYPQVEKQNEEFDPSSLDLSFLHPAEQSRIQRGEYSTQERNLLDRGQNPWTESRKPEPLPQTPTSDQPEATPSTGDGPKSFGSADGGAGTDSGPIDWTFTRERKTATGDDKTPIERYLELQKNAPPESDEDRRLRKQEELQSRAEHLQWRQEIVQRHRAWGDRTDFRGGSHANEPPPSGVEPHFIVLDDSGPASKVSGLFNKIPVWKEFSPWLKWASALFAVAATMTQIGEYGWAMLFVVLCGLCCLTQIAIWTASPSLYKNAIWKGVLFISTLALLVVAGLTLMRIKGDKPWSNLQASHAAASPSPVTLGPTFPSPSPLASIALSTPSPSASQYATFPGTLTPESAQFDLEGGKRHNVLAMFRLQEKYRGPGAVLQFEVIVINSGELYAGGANVTDKTGLPIEQSRYWQQVDISDLYFYMPKSGRVAVTFVWLKPLVLTPSL